MKSLLHILAISIVGIWGGTFIATKVLLANGLAPADIFFCRFTLAYVATLIICHDRWFADTWKDEMLFMLAGLFGGSLYFLTENTALMQAQASDVSIIVSSCPLLTSLILPLFYKSERMGRKQYAGLVIAFFGIALVVMNGHFVLHFSLLGYVLAFSASLTWVLYSLIMKRVMGRYPAWLLNRKVFFYGLLTIIPYYLVRDSSVTDITLLFRPSIIFNFLFLGLVANMGCYVVWTYLMREIGTVKATVYLYLNPLFTIIFARLFLDEHITYMALIGTAILIVGMVLAEKVRKPHRV